MQRHLAVLRSALRPGEAERLWIRAERVEQRHAGALLLSDRRLLFSGLGFFSQSQESWPLTVVEAVTGHGDRLSVRVLGAAEAFTATPRDVAALADALGRSEAPDPGVERPLADELERMATLRASGVLTEAEFTAAKRRLLG